MKKLIVLAIALACSTAANAQGERGYRLETDSGTIRVGARCELKLFGLTQPGRCVVGRAGRTTIITLDGDNSYVIARDPYDKYEGVFYHEKNGEKKRLASVSAKGECWIGEGVRFCAK